MRRFSVVLRDGSKTTVRGDRLRLSSDDHHQLRDFGYGDTHPYIQNRNGDIVFAGSFREVAYVADVAAEELPVVAPPNKKEEEKSALERWFDLGSKAVAILSGLAVVAFVILIATGHGKVGTVQAESLLTIFAFTLVGGIVSIGGVQLFSFSANLRRAQQRVQVIERAVAGSGDPSVRLVRTIHYRFESDDAELVEQLQAVRSNTLLDDYLAICAASPAFRAEIDDVARTEGHSGWTLTALSPNDNLHNGLVVNVTFERVL